MERMDHNGHRLRLRGRVKEDGLFGLKPLEILEFLLCYRIPRRDVTALAKALLNEFGSLEGVLLESDYKSLLRVPGVGMTVAEWLLEIGGFVRYYRGAHDDEMETHKTMLDIFYYVCKIKEEYPPPSTVMLCYDMNWQLIYQHEITPSRMWAAPEVVRDALDDVLSMHARRMVLLQFVGNINPEPGSYEKKFLRPFAFTASVAGCELVDFVIVSWHGSYSMYETGELPRFHKRKGKVVQIHDYQKRWPSSDYDLDFVDQLLELEKERKKREKLQRLLAKASISIEEFEWDDDDSPIDDNEVGLDFYEGD